MNDDLEDAQHSPERMNHKGFVIAEDDDILEDNVLESPEPPVDFILEAKGELPYAQDIYDEDNEYFVEEAGHDD